ncbi:zinc-ribbon domain-containing protein [Herbaspirillum sp. LeCh32-8]|uniref:DUF3426 domain-containing protein n=1 Tax=Herbaspirillum sp. LeCh32-8 TaxID=2821356 RepID=UPI001AEA84F0|nr:DUF3426 domain-containing protein [Herbaspirillum sp. LeCh32-8]MBP0598465.1 zinc-ribbon domain-containing protein [Herbaspirillum sp. LeCh32-8]
MALATQCPHCFTIFRVAGDQLKLRGGLVRCGSCRQVFNGQEFLVEASISDGHYQPAPGSKARFGVTPGTTASTPALVPPAPLAAQTSALNKATPSDAIPEVNTTIATAPAEAATAPSVTPVTPAASIPVIPEPKVFRSPASPGYVSLKEAEQPPPSAEALSPQDVPEVDDEITTAALLRRSSADDEEHISADAADEREPRLDDSEPFSAYGPMHGEPGADKDAAATHTEDDDASRRIDEDEDRRERDAQGEDENTDESTDDDALDEDAPAFVKSAERKERIGHMMRMVMMVAAGVMVPVLLLQSVYYWRNQLAVAAPPLRPMLNGMCATFHCSVGLPAEIERLTLESNELQVVPPNQNIYALSLVLRNRSTSAQAWPHVELTLNNDDEKAVVRRVFRPREYLPSPQASQMIDAGIAGESEQQLKLTFELNDALVSGYRIYLFYP